MDDNFISSFFEEENIQNYLKGGKIGYGIIAIAIPVFYFYNPLTSIIPSYYIGLLYIYLFINGISFLYLFGKEKFFEPKAICPHCKEMLKVIEISECPNCNTKLEKTTNLKCPNCGILNFEN